MTYATARDQIVTLIDAVADSGWVYSYERYADEWAAYLDKFVATLADASQEVRGWWVEWDSLPAVDGDVAFGEVTETWVFVVRGIMALDDARATGETFPALVESVKNALRAQTTLGVSNAIRYSERVTIPRIELRKFGGVLCHYAELRIAFMVADQVTWEDD